MQHQLSSNESHEWTDENKSCGLAGKSVNHSVQDDGGPYSFTQGAAEYKKQRLSD